MRLWLLFVFRGKLFGEKKSIRFIIHILQNFADIFYKILVYIEMAALICPLDVGIAEVQRSTN